MDEKMSVLADVQAACERMLGARGAGAEAVRGAYFEAVAVFERVRAEFYARCAELGASIMDLERERSERVAEMADELASEWRERGGEMPAGERIELRELGCEIERAAAEFELMRRVNEELLPVFYERAASAGAPYFKRFDERAFFAAVAALSAQINAIRFQ